MRQREGIAPPFCARAVIRSTPATSSTEAKGAVRAALRAVVVLAMATMRMPARLTSSIEAMFEPAGTR